MIFTLIVDRDTSFISMIEAYLSGEENVSITRATSLPAAIDLLMQRSFDIILSRYDHQENEGMNLLKTLRTHGNDTPVILYAKKEIKGLVPEAMKNGAEFFFRFGDDPEPYLLELGSLIRRIVERKQMENRLRRREQDLFAIVTKNADAMIVLDRYGYIQFVNPAAVSLFNIPEPDLVGKLIGFPIILNEPVDMYIMREMRSFVAVEMRMVEVEWQGKQSYLISLRDITGHIQYEEELQTEVKNKESELTRTSESLDIEYLERRKAEDALLRSEQKYRQIVELAQEGIVTLDSRAIMTFVNPRMADMLGYSQKELTGKPIFSITDEKGKETMKYSLEKRMQGVKGSYDIEMTRKDGSKISVIVNSAPMLDDRGNYALSISMITDITRRKKTEEELKDAKAQAELYLDLMGHDIGNLNQIGLGYLELAMESTDVNEIKILIAKPIEVLGEATRIINNVRKIQNVQVDEEHEKKVNICQILSDLSEQYRKINGRQITINIMPIPDCVACADELVKDVFINLISNSVKHSNPDKPLIINLKVERIKVNNMDFIRCAIEDNGPGISGWVKDKIFMRFKRGETKTHGKGLGLFIARSLIDSYNGKIWVEDRVPGDHKQGARFVVILPAA